MKAYYLKYGIFTWDLAALVEKWEHELEIKLVQDEYVEKYECYYLDAKTKHKIVHFSIHYAHPDGYHYSDTELLHPDYLLGCNVFINPGEEEYIDNLRQKMNEQEFIRELSLYTDEW